MTLYIETFYGWLLKLLYRKKVYLVIYIHGLQSLKEFQKARYSLSPDERVDFGHLGYLKSWGVKKVKCFSLFKIYVKYPEYSDQNASYIQQRV